MSTRAAPDWLVALQERFSAALCAPLDRSTSLLRAATEMYPDDSVADVLDGPVTTAAERLAVYNRQYWFRLFTVLQSAFPVTSRAMTYWRFNEFAARFVAQRPPSGWDIERVAEGFEAFFEREAGDDASLAPFVEAAKMDAAWRRLLRAKSGTTFQPTNEIAARLLDGTLVLSPTVALLCERWPWLEWKAVLATRAEADAPALPSSLDEPRWWALVRERDGIRHVLLEAKEGALLTLLTRRTVREALAELEASCPPGERAALPSRAQRWLAASVQRGFWAGVRFDDERSGAQGMTHE